MCLHAMFFGLFQDLFEGSAAELDRAVEAELLAFKDFHGEQYSTSASCQRVPDEFDADSDQDEAHDLGEDQRPLFAEHPQHDRSVFEEQAGEKQVGGYA